MRTSHASWDRKVGGVLYGIFLEREQRRTKKQGEEVDMYAYLFVIQYIMIYPVGDMRVEVEPAIWAFS